MTMLTVPTIPAKRLTFGRCPAGVRIGDGHLFVRYQKNRRVSSGKSEIPRYLQRYSARVSVRKYLKRGQVHYASLPPQNVGVFDFALLGHVFFLFVMMLVKYHQVVQHGLNFIHFVHVYDSGQSRHSGVPVRKFLFAVTL